MNLVIPAKDSMRARPSSNWSPYTDRSYLILSYAEGALSGKTLSYSSEVRSAFIDQVKDMVFMELKDQYIGATFVSINFDLSEGFCSK